MEEIYCEGCDSNLREYEISKGKCLFCGRTVVEQPLTTGKDAGATVPCSDRAMKPCPFCGSDARVSQSVCTGLHAVLCKNNTCSIKLEHYDSDEEAIEGWNKRAL